jgi:hypothetical protein
VLETYDPDQAYVLGAAARGVDFPLSVGSAWDLPVQLVSLLGAPGPLASADVLSGGLYPLHGGSAVFATGVSYSTIDRVIVSWDDAAGGMIQPTSRYVLAVWWAPSAAPGRLQLVARIPIVGKAVAP